MTRQRRGTDRHLAAVFCENARSFHAMARIQRDRHGGTSAYYLAIAIELGLKAYLLHRGITDEWNRVQVRHDLTKALKCARRAGLNEVPEGLPRLAEALSPLYATGALSRGLDNPAMVMSADDAHQVIADLLLMVEAIIGTERGTGG